MPTELLTFDEALQRANENRHLLLGNGFSQACMQDIFAYDSLFERADFRQLSAHCRDAFESLGTTDFEVVIDALRRAATLVELYRSIDAELPARLVADAEGLREVLVSAIAQSHPAMPGDIPDVAYWHCRRFLSKFKRIYTLNYDLLLYWAIMHEDDPFGEPIDLEADDGFRTPDDGETEYVTWEIEKTNRQNVFHLHGALHLFDAGTELQKYTWCNTGIRIIDQVRSALENGLYPLFVAEGEAAQKIAKIKHSDYLSRSFRSFSAIRNSLFVFGHSLGGSDQHIFRAISRGKVRDLFVSIYGDPESPCNEQIIERAEQISSSRTNQYLLNVWFYDAESAHIWA